MRDDITSDPGKAFRLVLLRMRAVVRGRALSSFTRGIGQHHGSITSLTVNRWGIESLRVHLRCGLRDSGIYATERPKSNCTSSQMG